MEQWKEYRLGEVGRIITGKTPRTAIKDNYGGRVPFLTPSDDMACKFVSHTNKTLTPLGLAEVKNCLLPENSICVSCIGSDLGKVVKTQEPSVTNQQINSIIPYKDFDADFVYYLMCIVGKDLNFISKTSTAVPIVNKSTFSNYKVRIPQIGVQKAIGNILSSLDDKIELNRKINSNLEEQAKALYSKYASLAIGTARIGDLANEVLDYTPCTYPRVYLLNSSDISEGIFPKIELVDNKDLKGHFKKRFRFGDILYSQIRPRNHHYGLVLFEADRYISSTRLMIIRTKKEQISEYLLYQAIISPCVCDEFTLKTETRSGTFPQGNYKDMANIIIPYGTKEQREKIEPKLKVLREAIYSYQKENVILSSIRDALLPKLMSGEIEVK